VYFGCATDCYIFTLPSTQSVSNYRLYGAPGGGVQQLSVVIQAVPEPAILALQGCGGVGIAFSRRADEAADPSVATRLDNMVAS
jgi:hypothetical protein